MFFNNTCERLPYDHYEGVYVDTRRNNIYLYVTADGCSGNGLLWCRDYEKTSMGYEAVSDFHHIGEYWLNNVFPLASYPTFSEIVALDYMREYARQLDYEGEEPEEAMSLLDIAQCHLIDHGMPEIPEGDDFHAFIKKWRDILHDCNVETLD